MGIIDLQRRLTEVGRIRIGHQVAAGKGTRPAKLDTFRLTSPDRSRIVDAARLYGGQVGEWQAPSGLQFEVITESTALDVIVPPADLAFTQAYELWSASGCQRRCNTVTEQISDGPCLCDPDNRECTIHTRLSVLLRDLPGLGVWRLDTQGWYAATELANNVDMLHYAAQHGRLLPARLLLDQRVIKRPDKGTRRFAVPLLDIAITPGQLLPNYAAPAVELGPAVIDDTPSPALLERVPDSVPEWPTQSLEEQLKFQSDKPKARRKNAQQPIPPTGVKPRKVKDMVPPAGDNRPGSGTVHSSLDSQTPNGGSDSPKPITSEQLTKLGVLLSNRGLNHADDRREFVKTVIERDIKTANDLTSAEAETLFGLLDVASKVVQGE